MNRKSFAALTALMWIALPFTILRYARVWNQLPVNMATHFNAAGEPNGWMPRLASLYFALGLTAFMLVIFTAMAVLVLKQKSPPDAPTFALLGFFYLILGGVYSVNSGLVEYNLTGKPVTVAPLLLGLPISIVLFVLVYLRARRGAPLPQETILAEQHPARHRPAVHCFSAAGGACLDGVSLPLHAGWRGDQHAGPAPALHSAGRDHEIPRGEVDRAARLRNSRTGQRPRLRLGQ